jgi:hypothetical protein
VAGIRYLLDLISCCVAIARSCNARQGIAVMGITINKIDLERKDIFKGFDLLCALCVLCGENLLIL